MKRARSKAERHVILGVHITDRVRHADEVQRVFTAHGARIRMRLGLHDVVGGRSSPNGLILLEMAGPDAGIDAMMAALRRVRGVQVRRMVFEH